MPKLFPKFLILNFAFLIFLCGCGDLESELASLTVSPANPTIGVNQSQLFSVTARDTLGFIVYVSPSWTTSGGIGNITSSGLFTASSNTGEGTVTAAYGTKTANTQVTITDKGWIEGRVTGTEDTGGVINISVALLGTGKSDLTDSSGNYSISGVSAGTYNVQADDNRANPVYQSSTQEVTVASGETATVLFFLTVRSGYTPVPTTTLPGF